MAATAETIVTNGIVTRSIDLTAVDEHPDNYNRHDDAQLEGIEASLDQFGYVRRIVVQAHASESRVPEGSPSGQTHANPGQTHTTKTRYTCVAGHGVLSALQGRGVREAEATILPADWPYERVLAYLVADNELARRSQPDQSALVALLKTVNTYDADLLPATGFDEERFRSLLAAERRANSTVSEQADYDAEPEQTEAERLAEKWGTAVGQTWTLGRHRLVIGDAREAAVLDHLMAGRPADGVWTDPPYGVSYVGAAGAIQNDDAAGLPDLLKRTCANVDRHLRPGAPIYMAHPAGELSYEFLRAWKEIGWKLHQTLVWVKDSLVLGHSDYHYQHEPILYGWKPGEQRPWHSGRSEVSVFNVPRPKKSELHPTEKPVGLIKAMLKNSLAPGAVVLEPFCGSGSTLVAAEGLVLTC